MKRSIPPAYSRDGNPTYDQLETVLTTLNGGVGARVFGSGMAAITSFLQTIPTGAHIAAPRMRLVTVETVKR